MNLQQRIYYRGWLKNDWQNKQKILKSYQHLLRLYLFEQVIVGRVPNFWKILKKVLLFIWLIKFKINKENKSYKAGQKRYESIDEIMKLRIDQTLNRPSQFKLLTFGS